MLFRSLSCLTLAALLSVPLVAQRGGPGPGGGPGRGPDPMISQALDLSEAQKTALKAILDKHQPDAKTKGEATRMAHEALDAGMLDTATTVEQVKTLHDKVAQAQFDMLLVHRAVLQEALALLTADQKAKLATLQKELGLGRMRGMVGFEGPGMPPPEKR
ncbi:MAG: periplasmic heavy metal sensor [Holophagaceae bacterium]|nr:periplasmic heavy metal sensor [Holophagaceae bacterium]